MNTRRIAVVVALLATVAALTPVIFGTPTDGDSVVADPEGLTIDTYDGSYPLQVNLANSGSNQQNLYVTNNTDTPIIVSVSGVDDVPPGVDYSTLLTIGSSSDSKSLVLKHGEILTLSLTFTADTYADDHRSSGVIHVTANPMGNDEARAYEVPVEFTVVSDFSSSDAYNKFFGVFPNTFGDPFDDPWVTAIVTMVLWILATIIVSEIIIPLLARLFGSRKTQEERKSLTKRLTASITALMFMVALQECTQIVGAGAGIQHLVSALATVMYVILGAYIAWMVYIFIVTAFLKGLDETAEVDGMDMSLLPLFKMLGKIVICVAAVCAALAAFGVDLAGILVSAGVVSLGITLGAQEILGQFFSGIVLLASRPFKKGDFVQLDGTVYRVRRVRLMYTELENWDFDRVVTMPNNKVSAATLVNLSSGHHRTRVFVFVDVAYGTDLDKVKVSLEAAGRKHPHVIQDGSCVPPNARLTEFGDSGIVFRLACYVDDFNNSAHYAGQIRELVYKQLTEDGIEIPYSRIQVDILSHPEGDQAKRASNF